MIKRIKDFLFFRKKNHIAPVETIRPRLELAIPCDLDVVSIKPTDIIVLKTKDNLNKCAYENIVRGMKDFLDQNELKVKAMVILEGGQDLSVLTQQQLKSLITDYQ